MVKVYFETKNNGYSQLVAIFDDEETYEFCSNGLQECAEKNGFEYVTESIEEVAIAELLHPVTLKQI